MKIFYNITISLFYLHFFIYNNILYKKTSDFSLALNFIYGWGGWIRTNA